MNFSMRIILITILLIILFLIYYEKLKKENFNNLNDYGYFENSNFIKKSKFNKKTNIDDKQDYRELEVKIQSTNSKYDKLNKYLKKYDINFIYNLENLDVNIPLVITYDNQSIKNDKNESFINFMKGINYYKYNFIVCGINTKWNGWYGRYKTYLKLL